MGPAPVGGCHEGRGRSLVRLSPSPDLEACGRLIHTPEVAASIRVVLETGRRRTFASALDWPGWARSGKGEQEALASLKAYAVRYSRVVEEAGLEPPTDLDVFEVVERLQGNATTDFGAPSAIAKAEGGPLTAAEAKRRERLLEAAQKVLDRVVAAAPAELRKGPRGGGRDRDAIAEHVRGAQQTYERQLERGRWPQAYAIRRAAWHVTDHLWEIEDRSPSP